MTDLHPLPAHLPAPEDDGGAAHLSGQPWPALALPATDGTQVRVSELPGRSVVYGYPMTARPDHPLPDGWDVMPGARRARGAARRRPARSVTITPNWVAWARGCSG